MEVVPVSFSFREPGSDKATHPSLERAGAEGLQVVEPGVLYWQEAVELTQRSVDSRFARFAELTRGLDEIGLVWDLGETNPPAPSVLAHFRSRAVEIVPRIRHIAIRTGANVGIWLSLRRLLPEAGFRSISVHRGVGTALDRARRER